MKLIDLFYIGEASGVWFQEVAFPGVFQAPGSPEDISHSIHQQGIQPGWRPDSRREVHPDQARSEYLLHCYLFLY